MSQMPIPTLNQLSMKLPSVCGHVLLQKAIKPKLFLLCEKNYRESGRFTGLKAKQNENLG